jgi:hypothetical protein
MQRLLWLALFCLLGIGGLFAARTVGGVTPGARTAMKAVTADVTDAEKLSLVKGDRLPSQFFDRTLPKTTVETVKIAPTDVTKEPGAALKQPEASKDDVVSWHWHEGAKVVRRRRSQ